MSPLKEAVTHLGLTEAESLALIDNLYLEGAFKPECLWKSIHLIGGNFGKDNNITPTEMFRHVYQIMQEAGAYDGQAGKCKPEYILKHLFPADNIADIQDAEDLIIYWSQSAYGRKNNQERNELPIQENLRANSKRYFANATTMGMIDTIHSDHQRYDETWVLGAPRQAMTDRMETLQSSVDSGSRPSKVKILTGGWELYAEMSGLYNPASGVSEGGKEYLMELAHKSGIAIAAHQPFVAQQENQADESGRIAGRTYLNHPQSEHRRLTESLMASDVSAPFLRKNSGIEIAIVETRQDISHGGRRPDTLMTVEQEARHLAERIKAGEFGDNNDLHIQLVSGQPSVERQELLTQRTVNAVLKEENLNNITVNIHGIGMDANVRIETLQSEAAALLNQHYLTATEGQKRKRPAELLMFRTRDENLKDIPSFPLEYDKQQKSWQTSTAKPPQSQYRFL